MTPDADDRFFRRWRMLTWLTALVTFLALLNTRELSPPVAVCFLAGWIAGVALRGIPRWWRPWMGHVVTLGAVPVILVLADFIFFNSVLNLLLFLGLAKCYSLRVTRDYLEAQVLCFFVLLSTSAMTISVDFAVFFLTWTVLLTVNLVFYGIARQRERAGGGVWPRARFRPGEGNAPRGLILFGAAASVLVFALTVAIFFLVPHVEMRSINAPLSARNVPRNRMTGFTEEFSFGEFKNLVPNETLVMSVEVKMPEGSRAARPDSLRVRGMALDHFDEESWQSVREGDRQHILRVDQLSAPARSLQRGTILNATIYQNPDITMRLFAPSMPVSFKLKGEYRVRQVLSTLSYQVADFGDTRESSYSNPFVYQCRSNAVEDVYEMLPALIREQTAFRARLEADPGRVNPEMLRDARRNPLADPGFDYYKVPWLSDSRRREATPEDREINLQLPQTDLTRRITELAAGVAPGPSEIEILYSLTRFLREEFSYSLTPDTPSGKHPIDGFLFDTRKGHCEYFATSLVLMLRSRGIQARIVNGFFTSEWNALAEVFSVKQSDAHSWVEVWIDGPGWLTVDPTPPGSQGRGAYGLSEPTWLQTWSEYLRLQWQRLVIDYSANRQAQFLQKMRELPGLRMLVSGFERVMGIVRRESGEGSGPGAGEGARGLLGKAADVVVLASAAAALWGAVGLVRRRRSRKRGSRTGVDYLDRLLRGMERLGVRRDPSATPGELLSAHPAPGASADEIQWLTALYYRERFAGRPASGEERARAMNIATAAARARADGSGRRD